ncbi:MAG: hypothetical protein HC887_07625 [Desulfobacteraceae bacterium]|nr:hypothetical protein [Desulfobacteraceae bacterium]
MNKYFELNRNEFQRFLEYFSLPGTLRFRNNKWLGLNREGMPFTVHVKHGSSRKYSPILIEAIAKDLKVTPDEFRRWYEEL